MIIIISNREVNEAYRDHRFFGEELAVEQGDSLRMAVARSTLKEDTDTYDEDGIGGEIYIPPEYLWELEPVVQGGERDFLSNLVEQLDVDAMNKKWVFFLHGNNQTIKKNLNKCREIEELHDVNIIALSWPSWGELFSSSLIKKIGWILLKGGGINIGTIKSIIGASIDQKQENYAQAVNNSEVSRKALSDTLQLVYEAFIQPAKERYPEQFSINMLIHSLGNRVLQHMINDSALNVQSNIFENVVLHQADVDTENHRDWVKRISLGKHVYVTANKYDAVLRISDIFGSNPLRLGNKFGKNKCTKGEVTAYIDFTKGDSVGFNHGLFRMEENQNEKINDCFNALLTGYALFHDGRTPLGYRKKSDNHYLLKPSQQQSQYITYVGDD